MVMVFVLVGGSEAFLRNYTIELRLKLEVTVTFNAPLTPEPLIALARAAILEYVPPEPTVTFPEICVKAFPVSVIKAAKPKDFAYFLNVWK